MFRNFLLGLADVKRGAVYLLQHRPLFRYVIVPTLINLALLVALVYFLINQYGVLFEAISSQLGGLSMEPTTWWAHLLAGLLWMLRGLLHVVLGLVLIGFSVLVMLFVSQIVNAPFYDWLSEAVEKGEGGEAPEESFSIRRLLSNAGKTIWNEIKKFLFFINIPIILLLLNLIPLVGALAYTVIANLFAMWDLGFNYASYPMGRRLIPFRKQIIFASHHKARLIGFGLPLMIPFFNLLLGPVFVVGGTLLYLDVEEA